MSIVAPNGQVRLFKNVPLDDKFEDTLWFESKQAQTNYFLSLTPVHTMYNATRVRDGVIAVDVGEDSIRDCNYLMFQNMNFSDKWFYAFIKGTDYVNNNMTYVTYEIDPLHTYGFDITLLDCFIERESTKTDGMFEHLVDEGIKVSEFVRNDSVLGVYDFGVMDMIVFSGSDVVNVGTDDEAVVTANTEPYQGFPMGVNHRIYHVMNDNGYWDNSEFNRLTQYLNVMVENQQTDSIIGAIMFPRDLISIGSDNVPYPIEPKELLIANFTTSSKLDNYKPKNNKLYNSPFCSIYFGTSDGQTITLQPEYLNSNSKIKIYANVSMTPSVMAMVENYKGKEKAWETAINYEAFPQCSFALDGYKAWVASGGLARLQLNTATSVAKDVINIGQGVTNIVGGQMEYSSASQFGTTALQDKGKSRGASGVGQALSGAIDLASDVGNAIITMDVAKTLPPSLKGSMNTSVLMNNSLLQVYTEQRTINKDVARSIDNYFTMYGYKVNIVKKPTLHNRSRFTYVKTKGCKVNGGAPTDMITKIENILNNGCRFWADHEHVGEYDYADNVPLGNNG